MNIQQVTVFGGSGFVGRAIVQALAREGYMIRVAVRRIGLAEQREGFGDVGQITLMQANLRMPSRSPAAIAGSDAVINAAGIPYQRGRQRYQAVHADGARAIAEAARAAGMSGWSISPASAPTTAARATAYIQSKVAAEDAIVAGFASATILRPSVVFGPDDALFTRLAEIAAKAPFLPLIGNGSAKVQPVFSGDVGRAVVAVLKRPDTANSVFELGGPRVYTYREIAQLVLLEIDRQKPIIGVPAGLMKIAGFFAQSSPASARAADHPRPGRSDGPRQRRAPRRQDPGDASASQPTAPEVILPTYLDRFRIGGRYNQHAPAYTRRMAQLMSRLLILGIRPIVSYCHRP